MNDNAKLYSKFLEQIMHGFVTLTGHSPRPKDMAQIRTIAVRLVADHPAGNVVSVTLEDGLLTVGVEPPSERSFPA